MRRFLAYALAMSVGLVAGCGSRFELPTEHPGTSAPPAPKSYKMIGTWRNMDGLQDVLLTPQGTGSQLFLLFNPAKHGKGRLQLYKFQTQDSLNAAGYFTPITNLYNPIGVAFGNNTLFVLDAGDSCVAKFDPVRGTCEPDTRPLFDPQGNPLGRRNAVYNYDATWRVRTYATSGGDTISTFTDTTFAYVSGVAADDNGYVYVAGMAIQLEPDLYNPTNRTRTFQSRIYRYIRGPRYPGIFPADTAQTGMTGANWHRDTTWQANNGTGDAFFDNPRRIAWARDPYGQGELFVADGNNNAAKLISSEQTDLGLFRTDGSEFGTGLGFNRPEGVAMDSTSGTGSGSRGHLFVVDRRNQRVLRYDLNPLGTDVQQVNLVPNEDGLPLLDPTCVAVKGDYVYVIDAGRLQLVRYQRLP